MKKLAKKAVAAVLGYQVRKLCKKNNPKVIAVAGSIGKTSTKLAIASVLKAGFRVRHQDGNYNDLVSVPLVFFGEPISSLFNPLAWLAVFWRNQKQISSDYPFDVVVLELGSDGPAQIKKFKNYLRLEIGVITAITPEHMQTFGSLDSVAKEELSIGQFSSLVLANKDLCDEKYLNTLPQVLTYGLKKPGDFGPSDIASAKDKSEAEQYSLLAAVAVARKLGMLPEDVYEGIKNIKPVPGRMQQLAGISGSTIIDDTYNSSPEAVKIALEYLYEMRASQKIAILGNMNELGNYSETAHTEIGQSCDPKQLDLVVTIGPDANKYLATVAEAKGCNVQKFDSPYEAGEYLKSQIQKGAVILAKGSQNGVFAEEIIKPLLADPHDSSKLVRQSPEWLKIKQKAFKPWRY